MSACEESSQLLRVDQTKSVLLTRDLFSWKGTTFSITNGLMNSADFLRHTAKTVRFAKFLLTVDAQRSVKCVIDSGSVPYVKLKNKTYQVHVFVAVQLARWCSAELGHLMDMALVRCIMTSSAVAPSPTAASKRLVADDDEVKQLRKRLKKAEDTLEVSRDWTVKLIDERVETLEGITRAREKDAELQRRQQLISVKDAHLQALQQRREEETREVQRLRGEIKQKEEVLQQLQQRCEEGETETERLQGEVKQKEADQQQRQQQCDAAQNEITLYKQALDQMQIAKEASEAKYRELQAEKEKAEPIVRYLMIDNDMLKQKQTFLNARLATLPEDVDVFEMQRQLDLAIASTARGGNTILEMENAHKEELRKLRGELEKDVQKQRDEHEVAMRKMREELEAQRHGSISEEHLQRMKVCDTLSSTLIAVFGKKD